MLATVHDYTQVSIRKPNEDRTLIALRMMDILERNIFMDKQSGKDFNRPLPGRDLQKSWVIVGVCFLQEPLPSCKYVLCSSMEYDTIEIDCFQYFTREVFVVDLAYNKVGILVARPLYKLHGKFLWIHPRRQRVCDEGLIQIH